MGKLSSWVFCGIFLLCLVSQGASAKLQSIDGIAALVNDSIITKSELDQHLKLIEQQIRHSGNTLPDHQALEKQVLDHLILNEIQLQLAKRTGIQIDDPALDSQIENIAKQNHMTVTQLREALTAEGLDYSHYRNNIRQQIIISHLQQRDIMHDVQVSDQEVSQFLQSPNGLGNMINEYRLGHILVSLPETPSPEELEKASQKVQQIIAQLKNGQDFAQIALVESSGEHALKGGDLGWRKLAEMPTIFVKLVPTLKLQDIPEPIRTASGFHIIKLLDKRTASEVQTSIGKTNVRHILIKTNALSSEKEAKQRLTELREKILQGEDFSQLAKSNSADLGSASNGGNLGWVSKDVLVPEFSEVMEKLAIQEVSEPFKTPFGWHILQVLDRKAMSNDEFALRQKAKEMIQQRKYEEKLQAWSRQIRDEAYVKVYSSADPSTPSASASSRTNTVSLNTRTSTKASAKS